MREGEEGEGEGGGGGEHGTFIAVTARSLRHRCRGEVASGKRGCRRRRRSARRGRVRGGVGELAAASLREREDKDIAT